MLAFSMELFQNHTVCLYSTGLENYLFIFCIIKEVFNCLPLMGKKKLWNKQIKYRKTEEKKLILQLSMLVTK
jgi:hypothetical protein